jgi:hypothetical protein
VGGEGVSPSWLEGSATDSVLSKALPEKVKLSVYGQVCCVHGHGYVWIHGVRVTSQR